jgi:hypothetical protein
MSRAQTVLFLNFEPDFTVFLKPATHFLVAGFLFLPQGPRHNLHTPQRKLNLEKQRV